MDYWNEIKDDEKELGNIVKAYRKVCPDSSFGTPRGGASGKLKFNLTKYKESLKTQSGVEVTDAGKMMWWGEFEAFARSPQGGCLNPTQTKARWESWKADATVPRDWLGPNPDDRFQMRVPLGKNVDFVNNTLTEKAVEQEGKTEKNASPEQLKAMQKRIVSEPS